MKDILKLVHVDNEKVVVQFKENLSNLDKALNPWILPNADYVTISRGKNHIMRVITKDGNSWSINWGDNGYTLISDSLLESRQKIVEFIENECFIPLDLTIPNEEIKEAKICYNSPFKSWQINFRGEGPRQLAYIRDKNLSTVGEAIVLASKFVGEHIWEKEISPFGNEVWRADL